MLWCLSSIPVVCMAFPPRPHLLGTLGIATPIWHVSASRGRQPSWWLLSIALMLRSGRTQIGGSEAESCYAAVTSSNVVTQWPTHIRGCCCSDPCFHSRVFKPCCTVDQPYMWTLLSCSLWELEHAAHRHIFLRVGTMWGVGPYLVLLRCHHGFMCVLLLVGSLGCTTVRALTHAS